MRSIVFLLLLLPFTLLGQNSNSPRFRIVNGVLQMQAWPGKDWKPVSSSATGGTATPGQKGDPGQTPTITIGTTSSAPAGTSPSVTNTGSNTALTLNFLIPIGRTGSDGLPGANGVTPTISVGTVTSLAAGSTPTVTRTGSGTALVFNFGIPVGQPGAPGSGTSTPGATGATPTITVGSVTSLAYGQTPTVTNGGSNTAVVLNFGIPAGKQGEQGAAGSGSSGATPYFDWVTPASAADLNTAIANCTKPVLYVLGTSLNISETVILNNKSNLKIVAFGLELVLTQWNSGTQGIMLDYRGTLKNIVIDGFRFNCPLPASSGGGDGGGYGMMIARGAVCPLIDGLIVQNCDFTSPTLHQNAISLISVGWSGYGIRQNVTVRNCTGHDVKRMFFECTNQEAPYNTDGTVRYSNIVIENCRARDLGNAGVGSSGGMMVSFDGPGKDNEVINCRVINPYFVVYEAVGTADVRFINNYADYSPGYTANFVGYSFTDGNHGASFGPKRITVTGGKVRCTGRGYNLTEATGCTFENVSFKSGQGNTLVRANNHDFRNCSFVGVATKEFLTSFNNAANNTFTDCYLGNEGQVDDNSGGRCTIVLFDSGCTGNRFLYLRHYQQKRTNGSGDFYEATYLNFSGGNTNEVLSNRSNNPSPGF